MNRSRIVMTLMLALAVAGLASFLVFKQLNRVPVRANVAVRRVVMAAKDLNVGEKLAEEDLRLAEWAVSEPPKGAFFKVQDAIGRAVLYPTFKDEIILGSRLASTDAGAGMAAVIPEGMRAVSIRVDDVVAVAGFVGPGSKVDILLTGVSMVGSQGNESMTKTILENVQVLAAGQKIQPDARGTPEKVSVVTLLCTIDQASKVTLAQSEGKIQLVLRNPTDTLKVDGTAGVARRSLFGVTPTPAPPRLIAVKRTPAPPPPPAPPPAIIIQTPLISATIEVLSGGKKTVVELGNQPSEGVTNK